MPIGRQRRRSRRRRRRTRGRRPAGPAPSTSRRGSGSRSRRRPRRCAARPCGSARRPRSGRASSASRPAVVEVERVGGALPAGGVEHGVGGDPLAALEVRDGAARRAARRATTSSPKRNVTPRSRRWYCSASTIWSSQKSSRRWRCSTTVTLVPSAANIDAYSMPITPAPTTTSARGHRAAASRMPSESSTRARRRTRPSSGRAGRVPTAITMLLGRDAALARCRRVHRDRVRVDEARRRRARIWTWLRASWLRIDVDLALDHVLRAPEQVVDRDVVLDPVALRRTARAGAMPVR